MGVDIALGSLKDGAKRITENPIRKGGPTSVRLAQINLGNEPLGIDTNVWEGTFDPATQHYGGAWVRGGALLDSDRWFSVASMQFSLHYMFQSKVQAEGFFATLSDVMSDGGVFVATTVDARVVVELLMNTAEHIEGDEDAGGGGRWVIRIKDTKKSDADAVLHPCQVNLRNKLRRSVCTIKFADSVYDRLLRPSMEGAEEDLDALYNLRYEFALHDDEESAAVDAPEWLVPTPLLKAVAEKHGFTMTQVTHGE